METPSPRRQSGLLRTGLETHHETKSCNKPSVENLAVMTRRPSSKAEQEHCAMMCATIPARDAAPEEKVGESTAPLASKRGKLRQDRKEPIQGFTARIRLLPQLVGKVRPVEENRRRLSKCRKGGPKAYLRGYVQCDCMNGALRLNGRDNVDDSSGTAIMLKPRSV